MFSLFHDKDIDMYYRDNSTFIFIGNNYENRNSIVDTISSYTKIPVHVIFINSSTEHLFNLSQEIAQSYSTMYPGNNKYIILDNMYLIDQFSRFGDIILSEDIYDSTRYNKDFQISDYDRVQIQCGCINNCKFCVNELHRSVSIPYLDIINQVNNYKDVLLSGINIALYNDGNMTLSNLCKYILNNCKNLNSLKLANLDLQQFEEIKKVINVIKDYNNIYPLLHFPIHTCDPELLQRNNLDYSIDQIEEIMNLCNNNQILYSWDIICGLPTETDEMFNNTLEMIKKYKPVLVYIYPFKFLSNSKYNKSDLVDANIIKQRCYTLASTINEYKDYTLKVLNNPKFNIIKDYIINFDVYNQINMLLI